MINFDEKRRHNSTAVRQLQKRHAVKLAGTAEKRDGHPYLKIRPDWFQERCFPVMYSLYMLNS